LIKAQKFKSAHTELRRLEKKRESLIEYFIDELNPISSSKANTSARSTGNLDLFNERVLYRKAISEKSGKEIVALVIKQRTEAAVEFQRSIEHSLDQLSTIASTIEQQQNKARRRIAP
ncbi:DUF4756 family protein, partial [Salmonella enterica subsp. enterica serovar Enteritidis]|nr:DUF4756 family protein [Salmonella enterica subsp. enterica serovar Enteritidis]